MNILYLNCANRKNSDYLEYYLEKNNIDLLILSESNNIKNNIKDIFKYKYVSKYKYGLTVCSNYEFKIKPIEYVIEDSNLNINNDNYKERIMNIVFNKLSIVGVHIDYGFYNPFAMNALYKYLSMHNNVDIVIGDFNSGYLNDNLDYMNGGIIFQNGFLYFNEFEKLGYCNIGKNKGLYSFVSPRNNKKYRIDHCFSKINNIDVEYIDEFLENNISDHKALLVKVNSIN